MICSWSVKRKFSFFCDDKPILPVYLYYKVYSVLAKRNHGMNVSTEANPQDILSQHYNQANLYFQAGEFKKALEELDQAKQYAADDHQREHIETTIATVKQNMGQTSPAPTETDLMDENTEPAPAKNRPNSMLILTVLVGLVCITPIAMKFIEIFSQPRVESTPNTVAEVGTETTTETNAAENTTAADASVNAAGEPAPESTAAVIVNAEQPESAVQNTQTASNVAMTISGNNVNVRAEASVGSARVATLTQGVEVQAITGQSVNAEGFQWQQIKTSAGQTGWVASRFLQAATPAQTTAAAVDTTTTGTETPAATPASDAAATAPAASGTVMKVSASGVSVRTTPSTSGSRLIALSNTTVTVIEPKAIEADGYSWSKIRTQNGTEGWVAHQFLSP
jgi:SH3-like domain-containing protein